MVANLFKLDGEPVTTQADFFAKKTAGGWSDLLYMPEELVPAGRGPLMFKGVEFVRVSFKDTDIRRARFIDCTFAECLFIGASLEDCEFTDCKFVSTNTSKLSVRRCLLSPSNFADNFDLVSDTNIAVDLYHTLYKNAVEEHQPEHAVESLYQMREAEFQHLDSQLKRKRISLSIFLWRKATKGVYRFISGYGLRFRRVVRFAVLTVVAFTAINYLFRDYIFCDGVDSLIDAFYFTGVTITTLGYGDITPTTQIGKLLVVAQAMTGFAVISIVLVGVANKALRGR